MEEEHIEVQLLEQLGLGQELTATLRIPASLTLERLIRERVAQSMVDEPPDAVVAEQERAIQSFQSNGFFVIVDGRQREDLQESLLLRAESSVRFIRLTPLVGG